MDWTFLHSTHLAHKVVDYPNVFFAIFVAAAPSIGVRALHPWRYWSVWGLSTFLGVMLAELGKAHVVWAGHPSFPSGHMAFALSAAVFLVYRSWHWLWITIPLCIVLAWALVNAFYHYPPDVAGSFLIAPPIAMICLRVARRWLVDQPRIAAHG